MAQGKPASDAQVSQRTTTKPQICSQSLCWGPWRGPGSDSDASPDSTVLLPNNSKTPLTITAQIHLFLFS